MKKNRKRNGIYREKDFYIFVGLWIIGFIVFTLIPMGYSLYASFTKWDGVSAPQFNGVQNYIRMFVQDERFWGSLKNTLYYTVVSVPLNIGIALLLAILLNKRLPGTNIFRGIIYAPSVLAGVAVYMGWTYLYGNDTGMINYLLYKIFHIILFKEWQCELHISPCFAIDQTFSDQTFSVRIKFVGFHMQDCTNLTDFSAVHLSNSPCNHLIFCR